MKIEVESTAPLQDFHLLRDQLVKRDEKFTPSILLQVPYEQLILCCTGEAGTAICDAELVINERQARRRRFLNMETDELAAAWNFLVVNQMEEDVRYDQTYRTAPRWKDLTSRQQVWAKLNCIYNHINDPGPRLKEAILLLRGCAVDHDLPPEVAKSYMPRLRGLLTVYPSKISDILFRTKILEIAENIFDFLPPEEALILQREEIQGYSCSSDCYRVLL